MLKPGFLSRSDQGCVRKMGNNPFRWIDHPQKSRRSSPLWEKVEEEVSGKAAGGKKWEKGKQNRPASACLAGRQFQIVSGVNRDQYRIPQK